jgi:hypothetical protein
MNFDDFAASAADRITRGSRQIVRPRRPRAGDLSDVVDIQGRDPQRGEERGARREGGLRTQ